MKRILTLILASLLMLSVICSCGGSGNGGIKGPVGEGAEGDYVYPDLDFKGEDIVVSTLKEGENSRIYFVKEGDDTSEPIDAAIWESNKRLEEKFNYTLVEDGFTADCAWEELWIEQSNYLIRNFISGDDVFDFIFFALGQRPDLITNGYLHDLSDYEALQLDKPWWDVKLNKDITINDRLYMASGAVNLSPYQSMACITFNKDIVANNQLDSPYDAVRDGTWTLDLLNEYAAACKNIGTDPTFWVLAGDGGTSTYGIGMHRDFPAFFLTGANIPYLTETDGDYNFTLGESDDFYTVFDKIQPLFTHCQNGGVGGGDASSSKNSIRLLFPEGRMAFCMNYVSVTYDIMRDSNVDFGFLPVPKLRVEQENYVTPVNDHLSFICLPSTSEKPEEVASLLDAMAYDRYMNVVPVFYDSFVTYKGVRDEDSLEMLELMTETRTMDLGIAYGWCYELVVSKLSWNVTSGAHASVIAANEGALNDYIDEFINSSFGD